MTRSASPPTIPLAVREQAAEWLLQLQAGAVADDTQTRWRQWREAHPDHERAWQHIEAFGAKLQQLSSPLAHATLAPHGSIKRRQLVKSLAIVLFVGGVARYAEQDKPWRQWTADYRTGTGERRSITLADGTFIALNTATAIDVLYTDDLRLVRLHAGEILIRTAHLSAEEKRARPFVVNTPQGRIRALGTYFSVRQWDDGSASDVSVFEGAVAVRPNETADSELVITAGKQTYFTRSGIAAPIAADETATAWIDGMIVARDKPLADFIKELSRHRPGRLSCDPRIADLKVTGTYPLADTDKVLAVLQARLPIRLRSFSRYWVTLGPRDDSAP